MYCVISRTKIDIVTPCEFFFIGDSMRYNSEKIKGTSHEKERVQNWIYAIGACFRKGLEVQELNLGLNEDISRYVCATDNKGNEPKQYYFYWKLNTFS